MNTGARAFLLAGGLASLAVALLHVAIAIIGAPAYLWFGAGPYLAALAQAGSPLPAALTMVVALALVLAGAYALSGAGLVPRLPRLAEGIWLIGAIYSLRGLAAFPQAVRLLSGGPMEPRELVFSLVSLGLGVLYLAGVVSGRRFLRQITCKG